MEPTAIVTTVMAVSKLIEKLTQAAKKRRNEAEVDRITSELNRLIARLNAEGTALDEENASLRKQLAELHTQVDIRNAMELRGDLYHLPARTAGYHPGLYCTRCMDADGKAIRLSTITKRRRVGTLGGKTTYTGQTSSLRCPECKTPYAKPNV